MKASFQQWKQKVPDLETVLLSRYLFLGILCVCPLPILILCIHFFSQLQSLESLEQEILRLEKKSLHAQEWVKKETSFLSALSQADHFYIDKHLETLTFLEPEVKKMEALLLDHEQDDALKKQMQQLKGTSNKLLFTEEKIRHDQTFQEIEEKQQAPIVLNEEDLKKLLSLIEGITIWPYGPKEMRPQLLITDFQLTKKELPTHENVFIAQFQLLKREKSHF